MIPLDELTLYFGIADDDTSEDDRLEELERNALAFIQTYTGHYFGPPDEHTEILTGNGGRRLYLSSLPISEAEYAPALVELEEFAYAGADGTELAELTDFVVREVGHEAWLQRLGSGTRWAQDYEYEVTYWRGYVEGDEPADVRQILLDLISVKRDLLSNEAMAMRSEQIGGYGYVRFGDTDLDAVIGGRSSLDLWRRPVFA